MNLRIGPQPAVEGDTFNSFWHIEPCSAGRRGKKAWGEVENWAERTLERCVVNHCTSEEEVQSVVNEMLAVANDLAGSRHDPAKLGSAGSNRFCLEIGQDSFTDWTWMTPSLIEPVTLTRR